MELSKRLLAVAGMVEQGADTADIGTDHGYVPIYLKKNNIVEKMIAMDIREGPLGKADTNIRCNHLENDIETRLSDGLAALKPGEVDTVIIGGMGGELTVRILTEGIEVVKHLKRLILQPQSEIRRVRQFIVDNNLKIIKEDMVCEEGQFYPIIAAKVCELSETVCNNEHSEVECEDEYTDAELMFGRCLLNDKNKILYEYLLREERLNNKILSDISNADTPNSRQRVREIKRTLDIIKEAKSGYINEHLK